MADQDNPEDDGPESEDGGTEGSLVVLAHLEEDPDEKEALESSLGREVVLLDPNHLDAEAFAQVERAAAVVIAWDLGSQAGLDVLEALRSDERMKGKPILMSSPEPTQAAVRLALEAGATGFIFEPLGSEELSPHMPVEESAASTPAEEGEVDEEGDTADS